MNSSKIGTIKISLLILLLLISTVSIFVAVRQSVAASAGPSELTANVISESQVNLSWKDNSTDEINYYVECTPIYCPSRPGALPPNTTSYEWKGLSEGEVYTFTIRGLYPPDNHGEYSNPVTVTTYLKTPTNLTLTKISATQVNLSWTNNSLQTSDYAVERKDSDNWQVLATQPFSGSTTVKYSDKSIPYEGGKTYYYRVKAIKSSNNAFSKYSNEPSIDFPFAPVIPNPTLSSFFASLSAPQNMIFTGNRLYLASSKIGLVIYDLSDINQPKIISPTSAQNPPHGNASSIAVAGNLALIGRGDQGVDVVDITNPISPKVLSTIKLENSAIDVAISGKYAFVATGGESIDIFDLTFSYVPKKIKTITNLENLAQLKIIGNKLIMTSYLTSSGKLRIFDISQPDNPQPIGSLNLEGGQNSGFNLSVSGNLIAIRNYLLKKVQLVNFQNPAVPVIAGEINNFERLGWIDLEDNLLYVGYEGLDYVNKLDIYNVTNPSSPVKSGQYLPPQDYPIPEKTVVKNKIIITGKSEAGLSVVDATNPAQPQAKSKILNEGSHILALKENIAVIDYSNNQKAKVLDISNPASPQVLAGIPELSTSIEDIEIHGNYAYFSGLDCVASQGVQIADITSPSSPRLVAKITTAGGCGKVPRMALINNYLIFIEYSGILKIYNITNPSSPVFVGSTSLSGIALDVRAKDNFVYASTLNGLDVINITQPTNPTKIKTLPVILFQMKIDGNYLYGAATQGQWFGFRIIDIAIPDQAHEEGGYFATIMSEFKTLAVDGNFVYARSAGGMYVIDVTNKVNPTLVNELFVLSNQVNEMVAVNKYIYLPSNYGGLEIYKQYGDVLKITKTVSNDTANHGNEITYTIEATNASPNVLKNAVISDQLTFGTTFVSASNGGQYDGTSRKVTWPTITSIIPNAKVTYTLKVRVD